MFESKELLVMPLIMAGSGHTTNRGWNVPAERPEINPEDYRSEKTKSNFRSELTQNCFLDNQQKQAYDTCYEQAYVIKTKITWLIVLWLNFVGVYSKKKYSKIEFKNCTKWSKIWDTFNFNHFF